MKTITICIFATILSFASYAQNVRDTTYFKHNNVNYLKASTIEDGVCVGKDYKNIDAKYEGDEATRRNNSSAGGDLQDINDYYNRNDSIVQKEVVEIFFQYIKENFSDEKKLRALNELKKSKKIQLYCDVWVEINGSFVNVRWSTPSDTYTDADIANLNTILRKKLILKASGLYSQRQRGSFAMVRVKAHMEFLEKELGLDK